MINGPTSPSRRLKLQTQGRSSSTPAAPRSVPNSAQLPQQDPWSGAYSPVSAVERSPSLADVSPVATNIRWGPTHPDSPVISDSGHSVDGSQQHQHQHQHQAQAVPYNNYLIDSTGRPMAFSAAGDAALMSSYAASNPSPTTNGYPTQMSCAQISPAVPSPAFAQFPATPQSFMSASPHHEQDHMQQLMQQQRTPVDAQAMMYGVPSNGKEE